VGLTAVRAARILVVAALVTVGCNGSSTPTAPTPTAPAPTPTSTAQPEPLAAGQPFELRVRVLRPDGTPAKQTDVRVYQTDAEGYYRKGPDGAELGGEQARIVYLLRTDDDGRFAVSTILPGQYPTGGPPPHVHFTIPPDDHANDLTVMLDTGGAIDRDHIARMARTWIARVTLDGGRAVADVEITAP
jgi:protocatechuate 3,4-dioxygenase beta subunit